jgi:hypothetical protein
MRTKFNKKLSPRAGRALIPAGALWLAVLATPAVAGPTIKYGDQSYLTIDYALQVWGQNRGYTSATDSGDVSQFFLRRNRLTFSGQYNDQVGFYVQVEAPADGKDGVDDKSTFYRDAYITLDYSDAVRFIVGRFKNTLTRENLEACLEPLTMDRAEVLSYTPFGGSRDTGVAMWGNFADAHFQYRLMVANGRKGDNVVESSPRITARVHWSAFDPEYDYGYRGTYLGTKRVLTIGAGYDQQANVAYSNFALKTGPQDYKGTTVDLFYEQPTSTGTYTVSAASMKYDTGDAINGIIPDPTLPITTQLEGYYAKVGYLLPDKVGPGRLQFFARYEESTYNLASGLRDNNWISGGANYYLDGQRLKVSFEYATIKFDKQDPTNPSLQDYNQATLGLQLLF